VAIASLESALQTLDSHGEWVLLRGCLPLQYDTMALPTRCTVSSTLESSPWQLSTKIRLSLIDLFVRGHHWSRATDLAASVLSILEAVEVPSGSDDAFTLTERFTRLSVLLSVSQIHLGQVCGAHLSGWHSWVRDVRWLWFFPAGGGGVGCVALCL
jgi:hypothetical protein